MKLTPLKGTLLLAFPLPLDEIIFMAGAPGAILELELTWRMEAIGQYDGGDWVTDD